MTKENLKNYAIAMIDTIGTELGKMQDFILTKEIRYYNSKDFEITMWNPKNMFIDSNVFHYKHSLMFSNIKNGEYYFNNYLKTLTDEDEIDAALKAVLSLANEWEKVKKWILDIHDDEEKQAEIVKNFAEGTYW